MVGFPAFPGIGRPARRPGILAGSSRGEWAAALPAGRPASSPGIIVMSPAGNSVRNMVRPSPLNSAGDELYVTRDGAHSWERVSVQVPQELYANLPPRPVPSEYFPVYDLPTFVDPSHGYLSVTYSSGSIEDSAMVLFVTDDGGHTWKPDRFLENLMSPIGHLRSVVADATWLICIQWGGHPTLMKVGAGAKVSPDANIVSNQASSVRARI